MSVLMLMYYYKDGYISEDDYADSLCAYQDAVDAQTSKDRREAEDDQEWGRSFALPLRERGSSARSTAYEYRTCLYT